MNAKHAIAAWVLCGIFSLASSMVTFAEDMKKDMAVSPDHSMFMPDDMNWVGAPASLPAGAKVAVIDGNPAGEGIFTMRIKMPADYKIRPHWHPAEEHVTVIEGTLYMGLGEKFDEKTAREIPTGGFAVMKTGTRHYAFSKKECIIQLHGMAPWGITYVDPADDPRKK